MDKFASHYSKHCREVVVKKYTQKLKYFSKANSSGLTVLQFSCQLYLNRLYSKSVPTILAATHHQNLLQNDTIALSMNS